MQHVILTLAGATEFDGTAGLGLVTFSDITLRASLGYKVSIVTLSLNTEAPATTLPQVTIKLVRPGGSLSQSVLVTNLQNKEGIGKLGCAIGVPREPDNGLTWQLQVLTPGKTATATLVVEYTQGYFGGADG